MSLYSWLNETTLDGNPPYNTGKYRFTYEQDLSNPRGTYFGYTGPTFVIYKFEADKQMIRDAYEEEIRGIIKELLTEATDEQVRIVIDQVLLNIDDKLNKTVRERVIDAFNTLGIISAEELEEITSH